MTVVLICKRRGAGHWTYDILLYMRRSLSINLQNHSSSASSKVGTYSGQYFAPDHQITEK